MYWNNSKLKCITVKKKGSGEFIFSAPSSIELSL